MASYQNAFPTSDPGFHPPYFRPIQQPGTPLQENPQVDPLQAALDDLRSMWNTMQKVHNFLAHHRCSQVLRKVAWLERELGFAREINNTLGRKIEKLCSERDHSRNKAAKHLTPTNNAAGAEPTFATRIEELQREEQGSEGNAGNLASVGGRVDGLREPTESFYGNPQEQLQSSTSDERRKLPESASTEICGEDQPPRQLRAGNKLGRS
ncbi:Uu.00g130260.m01.CDS01 [Anthostomella pinea]|uniref:Uu.00g130260.m01.CDS01 n=1 Tax=Anthostomella pinea TaxID=933095 RepID=A0AAI8VDC4_9PEZI|nr:Uu.00g130260.m01.CDS01 [Anthostomella pinea]